MARRLSRPRQKLVLFNEGGLVVLQSANNMNLQVSKAENYIQIVESGLPQTVIYLRLLNQMKPGGKSGLWISLQLKSCPDARSKLNFTGMFSPLVSHPYFSYCVKEARKGFPCFHWLWIDGRLTYSVYLCKRRIEIFVTLLSNDTLSMFMTSHPLPWQQLSALKGPSNFQFLLIIYKTKSMT